MPRPGVPARVTPWAARVVIPTLPCVLLQFLQTIVVDHVRAGAAVASLPWQGARVACAAPHEPLGARAPAHFVAAHDAGVLIVHSFGVCHRCVPVAVLLEVLLGRLGRAGPALAGARAVRHVGV